MTQFRAEYAIEACAVIIKPQAPQNSRTPAGTLRFCSVICTAEPSSEACAQVPVDLSPAFLRFPSFPSWRAWAAAELVSGGTFCPPDVSQTLAWSRAEEGSVFHTRVQPRGGRTYPERPGTLGWTGLRCVCHSWSDSRAGVRRVAIGRCERRKENRQETIKAGRLAGSLGRMVNSIRQIWAL